MGLVQRVLGGWGVKDEVVRVLAREKDGRPSQHSGRAITIVADGQPVNAAALRIALGSTKMRSTLLSTLSLRDSTVRMSGRGYGHGVGMSQWGAYGMAADGKKAEEIVMHYFRNVTLEKLW